MIPPGARNRFAGARFHTRNDRESPSPYCSRTECRPTPSPWESTGDPLPRQNVRSVARQNRCYDSQVIPSTSRPALRTVFLDRDGILNEKMPEGRYVTHWDQFRILPGVPEEIRRLNAAGLRAIVVSNQRGVALGLYTLADVDAIHAAFQQHLNRAGAHIDAFFICPHDKGQCQCRKPLPGLFDQAVTRFPETTAATSAMVGDSLSDIEFGSMLGMKTIFVEGPRQHCAPGAKTARKLAHHTCASLAEAVDLLLLRDSKPADCLR